ncbi:arylalkylamine N-acetyltransferase 1-like [Liolophura sinensis]|uniref:arylalkylamine N-acetyltransferase 1-like n=1 Tax=Liolophura sinensis TaxID=3198878 RepID=UPI00315801D9
MANVQIRKLQENDEGGARKFVCQEFFRLDPLSRAVNLDAEVDGNLWLNEAFPSFLSDGVSMVAIDTKTGEIIGIRFAAIVYKDKPDVMPFSLDDPKTRRLARLFEGLGSVHAGENIFEKYGVDRYASFRGLGVAEKYQKQGIASRLVDGTLNLIQDKNIRLVIAEASSQFSGRIFEKFGFKKGKQNNYDSMVLGGLPLVMTEELEYHKGIAQYIKTM